MFGSFRKRSLAKGRIGIAANGDGLAVAVVTREDGRLRLSRCAMLSVDTAGGDDALAGALRGAGLPRMPLSTVLRPEDYELALVEAPEVPPAELRDAMRWRLKDAIDIRVDDAVIDVFDIPTQHRGAQGRMMYAVAARRAAIDRWTRVLAALPAFDVVDVPELCLRNLASSLPNAAGGVALLHLGTASITVILVRGATFYFARQMDLNATQMAGGRGGATALDGTGIVLELQRSLDYYERHFDQPPITRIAVSPFGPQAQTLAADISRETGFDATALDLNALLVTDEPIDPKVQAACIMAVGAALREERRSL